MFFNKINVNTSSTKIKDSFNVDVLNADRISISTINNQFELQKIFEKLPNVMNLIERTQTNTLNIRENTFASIKCEKNNIGWIDKAKILSQEEFVQKLKDNLKYESVL